MRTTVLLGALALAGLANAQIFQSGFEDWSAGMPDGWGFAPVSNLAASAISQVTTNVHSGNYAVGLENATTTHKRFATNQLSVTNGTTYNVSFWVRGNGDIRVGLYDGRSATAGYAPYSAYTTVNGATWTHVTQPVTAVMTTTNGQFILSIRNTTAPDNLVVDDVSITEGGSINTVTIHDIQYTTDPSGDSPLAGQTVATGGIVSALIPGTSGGYCIQSGTGPWSGVFVFDVTNTPAIGDSVTMVAAVAEYNGKTELTGIASWVVVSSGNNVTPFEVATGDVSLEPLESVLVRVVHASCTVAPSGATFGKYNVNDGTGDCVIGKVIYTTTPAPVVGGVYNITGVDWYDFGEYNILPRVATDVELATGIRDAGVLATVAVGPNPTQDLIHITMGDAAATNVEYTLTDIQGRSVIAGRFHGQREQLDLGGLPAGTYQLVLRNADSARTFGVQVVH